MQAVRSAAGFFMIRPFDANGRGGGGRAVRASGLACDGPAAEESSTVRFALNILGYAIAVAHALAGLAAATESRPQTLAPAVRLSPARLQSRSRCERSPDEPRQPKA